MTDSLAGRAAFLELLPFSVSELKAAGIMPQTAYDIGQTAKSTGISEYQLRQMHRDVTLPGFFSGVKFNVEVPALLCQLRNQVRGD